MRLNVFCVAAVISLVAFPVPNAHGTEKCNGYIYDAINAGDNRAVVVNRVTRDVGIQDKRDARVDAMPGDFSASYEDCGNEVFFCLAGPLDIVIPKSMPMKQWQYRGLSCKRIGEPEGDAIRVTCSSSRLYHTGTSFTYSRSRGVLSFGNSRVGGARGGFALRGQRGLFSPGCNP
ncbi:hypothetical protein SAMN05428972_3745 [Rhodanobacter sp. OK091]|nr:hypothetical protein SAMN05428972_3745 [Rhodanobacter sp. OK091]